MNALESCILVSLCLALCQTYCEFPTDLRGSWSVPYLWDSITISETTVIGLQVTLSTNIVLNNFTCIMNNNNRYVIKSDTEGHSHSLYMCWEFIQVTSDVYFLYQMTAQDDRTDNKTWTTKSNPAKSKYSDACSSNSASYFPFFRRDVELWKNWPQCPQFEVSQVLNCRETRHTCGNVDYHLYKPVSSVMSCLSLRLRCAFLYLVNTEIDGDKVVCVTGQDVSGNFSVGFNLGLCKYLQSVNIIPCDVSDRLHPACSSSCQEVMELFVVMVTWSSVWWTIVSLL